ncbi:MAG TPA: SUMF1/EgtB/PvdO family nonheme iron enzyme [Gemmatimonadaceae bacterium]
MSTRRVRRWVLACAGVLSCGEQIAAQETGRPAPSTFRECSACPELVVIQSGRFTMGSSPTERKWAVAHRAAPDAVADEAPQRVVAVRAFALGKYDVTRGEYERFVRESGYPSGDGCVVSAGSRGFDGTNAAKQPMASWRDPGFDQTARDPAVCVSWHDARAYVAWLNDKVRRPGASPGEGPYRLPTEAEWEYAARGGTTTRFWWGDDDGDAPLHAWYKENAAGRTHPVGSMSPNPFGLHDMVGDVWQWTEDCYAESYVAAPTDGSAVETPSDCLRVDRGGSWFYPIWLLRPATRERNPADYRDVVMGFRVARTVSTPADPAGTDLRRYMRAAGPRIVLEHVRVIDATGAAPADDRNVTIEHGRIAAIADGADSPPADSTIVLDLRGYSVMPLSLEAGLTPTQAIRSALLVGATFLGRQDRSGSITVGGNADFMVIKGDPGTTVAAVEKVEIVFKDGIGYDTAKLRASRKGP